MIRVLVIAALSGCMQSTPTCRPGDVGCAQVRDVAESYRGRLGGRCGWNAMRLQTKLRDSGSPAIVHYLDDLDPHIARAAAYALRGLGGDELVAQLCASGYVPLNRHICR